MKQDIESSPAIISDSSPCPYFCDGRESTVEYCLPGSRETLDFHTYLAEGYRRIGRAFYHNVCQSCSACKPLRIDTGRFKPGRSQTRTSNNNSDIRIQIASQPSITAEKIALYHKYIAGKHPENKDNEISDPAEILLIMHYGYARTIEMNYYLDNRLIGVGIVDEGKNALSSNYFYYDTDYLDRRPGVFSIIKEIELAKSLGKKYYYLGFYIEENPKMSYKKFFRPNQIFEKGQWRDFLEE